MIVKKMISSISLLQDKSSEFLESNILRNSRGISLSNITATSDTSFFSTSCTISPDNNQINPQKVSIFFMRDHNTQKMMTSKYTRLTVAIDDIIIYQGIYYNISQKPRFKYGRVHT